MGMLETTFKIALSHPLLPLFVARDPLSFSYQDTGNTVEIEPLGQLPSTQALGYFGSLDQMILRVRRECKISQPQDIGIAELSGFRILSDAARAFHFLFEAIRETDFRKSNVVAGYPVAFAEEIQKNWLVRTCDLDCSYDGVQILQGVRIGGGIPSIQITENAWNEAARRFSEQEETFPYLSYALDAAYFAESDPVRAIIMACAAWETALRHYLANVASARDEAYLIASQGGNLPKLEEFMRAAKGGDLFYESLGHGSDEFIARQRECIRQLPTLRNKLVHNGRAAIPEGLAIDAFLAVFNAIEWLFA